MAQDNLIRILPVSIENTVRKAMAQGEQMCVALPGAMGEALVVTDRRVVVARENSSGNTIEIFSHPLARVTGSTIGSTGTGGSLAVAVAGVAPEDQRTVYFPAEKMTDFQKASAKIDGLLSSAQPPAAATVASASECPSCRSGIRERDVFCSVCGEKLRDICQVCGGEMRITAAFCPHCGSPAVATLFDCPACGGRVNSTVMSNCVHCGVSLLPKCVACGTYLVPGWTRCRYCGRTIGSNEGATGADFRSAIQRSREEQPRSPEPDQTQAQTTPASETDTAAAHNAKGAQLFDEERMEEAVEEFRRAVMLAPDNASYHCNLAVAYDETDQDDDARREYERTLELNPNDTTAMLYIGYMLNENDQPERAAELWRRLIQVAPGTPEAEEAQQNLRAQEAL